MQSVSTVAPRARRLCRTERSGCGKPTVKCSQRVAPTREGIARGKEGKYQRFF